MSPLRRDRHCMSTSECTRARNRTRVNILGVTRPLATRVVWHDIVGHTQGSDRTSAKTRSVKRRSRAGPRSRSICGPMTHHGGQNPICEWNHPSLIIPGLLNLALCLYRKYHLKAKKQKISGVDDPELEESVRTLSALFSQAGNANRSVEDGGSHEALEARVASISAEIAAAIAQATSRALDADDEELEEEDGEGDGWRSGHESILPKTSGIRGESGNLEDDDDSDTFPIPLRTRKGKEAVSVVGTKRKR